MPGERADEIALPLCLGESLCRGDEFFPSFSLSFSTPFSFSFSSEGVVDRCHCWEGEVEVGEEVMMDWREEGERGGEEGERLEGGERAGMEEKEEKGAGGEAAIARGEEIEGEAIEGELIVPEEEEEEEEGTNKVQQIDMISSIVVKAGKRKKKLERKTLKRGRRRNVYLGKQLKSESNIPCVVLKKPHLILPKAFSPPLSLASPLPHLLGGKIEEAREELRSDL